MSQHELQITDQGPDIPDGGYKQGSWLARQHMLMGYNGSFAYFLAGEYAGRALKSSDDRVAFFVAYRDVMHQP